MSPSGRKLSFTEAVGNGGYVPGSVFRPCVETGPIADSFDGRSGTVATYLSRCCKDHGNGFPRHIPRREVPAQCEPVQVGGREHCFRTRCLSRQTEPIAPSPSDHNPARRRRGRTGLLGAVAKIIDQRIKRRRGRVSREFGCNGLAVERPWTCGKLRQQQRA